jgi:shikimate dehydrogenase
VLQVRLAVLGDPLRYTRSPDLHRAGLAALGVTGDSTALRTTPAELGQRLADLASAGYLGTNLTHPHKESVIAHLARISEPARRARSVNTVGLSPDGWWGDTTDGPGFLDLIAALGRDARRERVVLLGAGGAARGLALALGGAGAGVCAWAREPERVRDAWREVALARLVRWGAPDAEEALSGATLIVNATPLSTTDAPIVAQRVPARSLAVDLTYGERLTPWVLALRAAGREAFDGLGLLVHQARRSLGLWLGREVPLEPLERAVGWPR